MSVEFGEKVEYNIPPTADYRPDLVFNFNTDGMSNKISTVTTSVESPSKPRKLREAEAAKPPTASSSDGNQSATTPLAKPIACKNCNRINFQGTHCKNCQQELVIVDRSVDIKNDKEKLRNAETEEAKSEIAKRVADGLVAEEDTLEADSKTPIEVQDKIPKAQFDSNKRRILQKNLKAKLRDSRMTRSPLTKETEILGKNGKRIAGARKVPVTQMLPVTNSSQPWAPM